MMVYELVEKHMLFQDARTAIFAAVAVVEAEDGQGAVSGRDIDHYANELLATGEALVIGRDTAANVVAREVQ